MKRSTVLPLLAASAAALFAGCEWTHSSGESSWSGSYDNMNFAGTYRISALNQTSDSGSGSTGATWTTASEGGGTFAAGKKTASGATAHNNIVPGSVKISAGKFVWVDDGSGNLTFNGGSSGSSGSYTTTADGTPIFVGKMKMAGQQKVLEYGTTLPANLVEKSVSITIGGTTFTDDGNGNLTGPSGWLTYSTVNYQSGYVGWTINQTKFVEGSEMWVRKFQYTTTVDMSQDGVSGSGNVRYSSGAWTLVLSTGMSSASPISVTYSYYSSTTGIDASTFDATKVTAITVSQTGQNLTLALNNGVTMAGRFTSVHKSTSSNVDLYNAQFQVSGSGNKLVGTLSYDQANMVKVLNGTWTSGSKTFDVSATGPSWSAN